MLSAFLFSTSWDSREKEMLYWSYKRIPIYEYFVIRISWLQLQSNSVIIKKVEWSKGKLRSFFFKFV